MATNYLEYLIHKFLTHRLTDAEKKELSSGWDVERHIDEEAEEEIKEQLYLFVKSSVLWQSIIRKLQDEVVEDEDEEEEDADGDDSSVEYD